MNPHYRDSQRGTNRQATATIKVRTTIPFRTTRSARPGEYARESVAAHRGRDVAVASRAGAPMQRKLESDRVARLSCGSSTGRFRSTGDCALPDQPADPVDGMRPLRLPAIGLGCSYLVAIVMLGPLLGSSADASTAFAEHFDDDGNRFRDLTGSLALLVAAAMLVWTAVTARQTTAAAAENSVRDLSTIASVVTSSTLVVASGLLMTVPLTTSIGDLTDDPGIAPVCKPGSRRRAQSCCSSPRCAWRSPPSCLRGSAVRTSPCLVGSV